MDTHENVNRNDKLKDENDFLKMKIMLENGAHLNGNEEMDLRPDIENEFLKNIIEFEKQFQLHKTIRVFDKIGRPHHFKPINEIPDAEIEQAWQNLSAHMSEYGVELSACSPKITPRELYRFTTEELFEHEMEDMDIPGMMSCFIYDEFHPDHEYENTKTAIEDCIKPILSKEFFEWMHHFRKENIRLNKHFPITSDEFKKLINHFKDSFSKIKLLRVDETTCKIIDKICFVKGVYKAKGKLESHNLELKGAWLVEFELDVESGYWCITNVQIEGINF